MSFKTLPREAGIQDDSVNVAKLKATGTPSISTFLRGDGEWGAANSQPAIKPFSTQYVAGVHFNATTMSTIAVAANALRAYPVIFPYDLTIDQLAWVVTTTAATGVMRSAIYGSNSNGVINGSALVASAEASSASLGTKTPTVSYTLEAGVQYWFAIWSGTASTTVRGIPVAASCAIFHNPAATSSYVGIGVSSTYSAAGSFPTLTASDFSNAANWQAGAVMPALYARVA